MSWTSADVWVLAAITVHHRRCTLTEVVASGDWINHAILLQTEVEEALGKLAGAGLVRVYDDWTFELTDEGADLWESEYRDLKKSMAAVQEYLAAVEPGRSVVRLPAGAVESAAEEYRRSVS